MTSLESTETQANLSVTSGNRRVGYHALADGESVIVGSGGNCGVRLDNQSVSSIHCVIRLSDGQLFVQDWCSNLGTLLNGVRVDEETQVPDGSTIRIGQYEIVVNLLDVSGGSSSREVPFEFKQASTSEPASRVEEEPGLDTWVGAEADGQDLPLASIAQQLDEGDSSCEAPALIDLDSQQAVEHELVLNRPEDNATGASAEPSDRPRSKRLSLEGIDPEIVSLLQAEIECLQSDLLDKDRQLADLEGLIESQSLEAAGVDDSQTETLVARLEQLLEELDGSDQRIRVLEDLLQAEQDVTRAQQEERAQVEAWLNDIERRITSREEEWKAERETLLRRVDQIKAERDEADRQLASAENSPHGVASQQSVVKELRERIDKLQDELSVEQRHRLTLEHELDELKSKSPEEARQEYIESALREDRLKLAQEQAALSRERAQLSALSCGV